MNNSTERLGTGKILPLVFRLTIPAVIAQLITFLYNAVDRIYVAKIGGSGTDALAAIGVVLPVTLIVQAFANLLGLGGSPRASMKFGEGDEAEANKIFNTSVSLAFVTGIAIGALCFIFARNIVKAFGCPPSAEDFAVRYLKIYSCGTLFVILAQGLNPFITAQGASLTAMLSVGIGALLNVALDPLFIFVFDMGIAGASLATVLSSLFRSYGFSVFYAREKARLNSAYPK